MNIQHYQIRLCIFFGMVLVLMACQPKEQVHQRVEPAQIEHLENSELSKLTLTEEAVKRLGIQTAPLVKEEIDQSPGSMRLVAPYATLLYDVKGRTWVYTSPAPRTYIRHQVKVDFIKGDKAILHEGPPEGTQLVTVGVAELYGTEYEVGH